ncbi:PP2C family protein-serine/threonine phosphatase [Streptomyces sp. NPDC004629]|uniref:PP2C family protein-serine/threonine phosphatase n=1 Tax=Streptomyces sp. NPDC004629 TaxID=3364705 RepID=UPI0036A9D1A0
MSAETICGTADGALRSPDRTAVVSWWLLGPALVILAIPVADAFLPPDIHIAHLLVVACAVTAIGAGPIATALVCGLAVLALVGAGLERHTLTTESVLVELAALAGLCVLLIVFARLRARREGELLRVRSVSEAAQRVVLRPLPERAGPVSLASEYRSAEADARVGGDLYATARSAGSTRLLIGDVRGKGLASISDTAIVLGAFRAAAHRATSLPDLAAYMEDAVSWGLAEFSEAEEDFDERFVTAVIAEIPDDEPVVRLISCGHPPPVLLHGATARHLTVPEPAPPLGLGDMSASAYVPATHPFHHGDRLVLYTDGVSEARDERGVFYPLCARLAAWADEAPLPLVRRIAADLREHAGGRLDDDMALIVARRDGTRC